LANGEPEADLDQDPADPLPDRRSRFADLAGQPMAAHQRSPHICDALAGESFDEGRMHG
jgi:hypothetical protein